MLPKCFLSEVFFFFLITCEFLVWECKNQSYFWDLKFKIGEKESRISYCQIICRQFINKFVEFGQWLMVAELAEDFLNLWCSHDDVKICQFKNSNRFDRVESILSLKEKNGLIPTEQSHGHSMIQSPLND